MPKLAKDRARVSRIKKRWHPDSNWGMEALQASALPLGDATEGPEVWTICLDIVKNIHGGVLFYRYRDPVQEGASP